MPPISIGGCLHEVGYRLAQYIFKRKHPSEYANLQYALAKGNNKQIEREWKDYFPDAFTDKYKDFKTLVRFYNAEWMRQIGLPADKVIKIALLNELLYL